ncbi:MAG TPA: hypothetical protein VFP59_00515 [Candidatus Angelobacter sp.]|nr:hypothetical protein [Candidatus Angelobacter sp.]
MAVGTPTRFPDSDSPLSGAEGTQGRKPNQSVRFTDDELKAIRDFFLLLDKWDRQKKIA